MEKEKPFMDKKLSTKKYIVEFIGTFFLTFVAAMSGDAIAVASVLMALIYAGAHISGAHYNPAVTLAIWLAKKMSFKDLSLYMLAQFTAAFLALNVSIFMLGFCKNPIPPNTHVAYAFIAEYFFMFLLIYVVLNVAFTKKNEGNQFYGVAIGLVVLAGIVSVGKISGAFFNPAIALAYLLCTFNDVVNKFLLGYIILAIPVASSCVRLFTYITKEENV